MRRALARLLRSADDGQVLLLTLVYSVVAFSLVTVVVDATAVHLARTQLLDTADAAALDAADAVDLIGTYAATAESPQADDARRTPLVLADATVREEVRAYLRDYRAPGRLDAVVVSAGTGSPDGQSAVVVLTGRVRLPIGGAVVAAWSEGVTVTVRSRARSRVV
ncbi:MAG TPA: pilus assembly protein TadG-related protein [Actinomycetales bacterium]|nr:pilus assembly protein TadG-related protein [Actinomycetales bacterium]